MTALRQELLKLQATHKSLLLTRKNNLQALSEIKKTEKYLKGELLHRHSNQSIPLSQKSIDQTPQKQKGKEKLTERKKHSNHQVPNPKHDTAVHQKLKQKQDQRNKRMMKQVSSYLLKAKTKLQSQQDKLRRKQELQRQVKEQQEQRVRLLRQEKMLHIEKDKQDMINKKVIVSKQLLDLENQILLCKYKIYQESLMGNITKTLPAIFWRPNKSMTFCEIYQQQKQMFLKNSLEEAQKKVHSISNHEEYVKMIHKDKQQYYHGILTKHVQSMFTFIMTKSEPAILWKPKKDNKKTKALEEETKSRLVQDTRKPIIQLQKKSIQSEADDDISQREQNWNKLD